MPFTRLPRSQLSTPVERGYCWLFLAGACESQIRSLHQYICIFLLDSLLECMFRMAVQCHQGTWPVHHVSRPPVQHPTTRDLYCKRYRPDVCKIRHFFIKTVFGLVMQSSYPQRIKRRAKSVSEREVNKTERTFFVHLTNATVSFPRTIYTKIFNMRSLVLWVKWVYESWVMSQWVKVIF